MCRNINTERFSPWQNLQFHSWLPSRKCRYRERAENQQLSRHLVNVSLLWIFTEQFIQYASCLYAPSEVHILQMSRDARPLVLNLKVNPLWVKMVYKKNWTQVETHHQFYQIFILITVFLENVWSLSSRQACDYALNKAVANTESCDHSHIRCLSLIIHNLLVLLKRWKITKYFNLFGLRFPVIENLPLKCLSIFR